MPADVYYKEKGYWFIYRYHMRNCLLAVHGGANARNRCVWLTVCVLGFAVDLVYDDYREKRR
jgi:hypothetical protein